MGYSTCMGPKPGTRSKHVQCRTCDGCDACPVCDGEGMNLKKLRCQRCCGDLYACAKCEPDIRRHVQEADRLREIERGQGALAL